MIERLAGAAAQARSAGIACILDASFDDPARAWTAGSVASTLSARGTVALLAPGGCALLRVAADEAELLTLAVVPEARGRGLGRALLNACLDEAAALGAARLHLEVGSDNVAALALYDRAGFLRSGLRRGYYRGPRGREDAVLMACDLGST